MSRQTILKWGNSLAFRLPAALARQLEVREGATVIYRVNGRKLTIEPSEPALPAFTEDDLRKAARKSAKGPRVQWGAPKGKEIW